MISYLDLQRVNAPYEAELRRAMGEVMASGWYLRGEATRRFERHYADYIGTRYCVGCGNGLDALSLIFKAYREMGVMQEGDEVLVPANTYIASVLSITDNGLTPVFVEPDIHTLQIDDTLISQAVTPRTRALLLVHLYGCCAYTGRVGEVCRRHGLRLIEDNAQAHGCTFEGRLTGSLGDAAAHSFYPTKNLGALGDAGAVTTDDAELADVVRALGNYGSHQRYVNTYQGRNSRMDELQAAILDVKLCHLDASNRRRKEIAAMYKSLLSNPLISTLSGSRDSVWHIFPVLCECRDMLRRYLQEHGVETQIHYPTPPHRQPCYTEWSTLSFPVTERIHREELSLPCNSVMTDSEVATVLEWLNAFRG